MLNKSRLCPLIARRRLQIAAGPTAHRSQSCTGQNRTPSPRHTNTDADRGIARLERPIKSDPKIAATAAAPGLAGAGRLLPRRRLPGAGPRRTRRIQRRRLRASAGACRPPPPAAYPALAGVRLRARLRAGRRGPKRRCLPARSESSSESRRRVDVGPKSR